MTIGRPREHQLFMRHRVAMAVAVVFFGVAAVLFVLLANDTSAAWVQQIDDTVRDAAQGSQWGPFTVVATILNFVGSWYVTWPLRAFVAGWLWIRKRWEALVVWVVAIAIYEPLVGIVKDLYGRARPPSPEVAVTGLSFPSGHATVGAAVAIGLVMVIVRAGPRQRIYQVVAGGFAFLMGASRVYLDAHWMSDVIAGTAMGAAVMIGVGAVVHELNDRLHARGRREFERA
jgi:undecaprenyl-diphosphatase